MCSSELATVCGIHMIRSVLAIVPRLVECDEVTLAIVLLAAEHPIYTRNS